jgi:uncharacterized protein (UPF0276 family)
VIHEHQAGTGVMTVHTLSRAFSSDATFLPASRPIPAAAGIGLRSPHHAAIRDNPPAVGWLEAHPENHMTPVAADELAAFAERFPMSLHAVGLSLGSASGLDHEHLLRLRDLERRIRPGLMSDHLSWSLAATRQGPLALPDLLPLPYTEEALEVVIANIDRAQTVLGRRLLIENPSTYLEFTASALSEAEFLAELVRATGCGVLLDINNIAVSALNRGLDPAFALSDYLALIPASAIGEIHLAGHAVRDLPGGRRLRIDDHGSRVGLDVWRLFETTVHVLGPKPTLVEWDTDIPDLSVLLSEAAIAQAILNSVACPEARCA